MSNSFKRSLDYILVMISNRYYNIFLQIKLVYPKYERYSCVEERSKHEKHGNVRMEEEKGKSHIMSMN